MSLRLPRAKKRRLLLALGYRLARILSVLAPRRRLSLFLDLEWLFERLALEESFRVFGPREHPVRTESMAFLTPHLRSSDRVLDFGCKYGEMTLLLSPHCLEVVGIDTDAAAVARATAENPAPNVTYQAGEGVAFFSQNATRFDVVILSHVIEHIDDPRPLLEAAARACRNLYVEVPDIERSYSNAYRVLLGSDLVYSDTDHVWEFDRRDLRRELTEAGLAVVEEESSRGVLRLWCAGSTGGGRLNDPSGRLKLESASGTGQPPR